VIVEAPAQLKRDIDKRSNNSARITSDRETPGNGRY
jgi:hypothetical protein